MGLSKTVALVAFLLAVLLVTGYVRGDDERNTAAERAAAREAERRVALIEHERRKAEVSRRCAKPIMTATELEACRAAYRRL